MPDSFTPYLGLIKPEIGASRDTWGAKQNTNLDVLDEFVGMAMPVGAIIDYAGPTAPPGWLVCDGRLISRTTYSQLFAAIGTYWGAGDGSTTFKIPPTQGRSAVGPGTVIDETGASVSFTFAQLRGAVKRPITTTVMPSLTMSTNTVAAHSHAGSSTGGAGSHAHSTDVQGSHIHSGSYASDHAHSGYTDAQGAHAHNITIPAHGGGAAAGPYDVTSTVFGNTNYTTDVQGAHSHNVATYGSGILGVAIVSDGAHGHNISGVGDHTHALSLAADGGHSHTVTFTGGGEWYDIMSPVMVTTKIIYAGSQAVALALGVEVGSLRRPLLRSPSRGAH